MKTNPFDEHLKPGPCNEETQQWVLRLPADLCESEDEKNRIIEHIASCASCRDLLESYGEVMGSLEDDSGNTEHQYESSFTYTDIGIAFTISGIEASGQEHVSVKEKVPVLDTTYHYYEGKGSPVVFDHDMPAAFQTVTITNSFLGLEVTVETGLASSRYHFIQGDKTFIATPHNGRVKFMNVRKESFVITRGFIDFLRVEVRKG